MLDDAFSERRTEDDHKQAQKDKEKPLHHEENVRLNVDSQSYDEHSDTTDSDKKQKESKDEINKIREILRPTHESMKLEQSSIKKALA